MGATTGFTLSCAGQTIPAVGLGTVSDPRVDAETTRVAVLEAIKAGYRHFDSAFVYGSEKPVGEAIAEALRLGLAKSRDEFFITTKLWCTFAEGDQVITAIKMSLKNLQMDYVDMYLVHLPLRLTQQMTKSPVPREHIMPIDLKSVWAGMEECQNLGLTKGIGVSNFSCKRLEDLISFCKIPPAINQVELNPFWRQKELMEFCKAKGIHITAYSPLGAHGTKWGDNRILGCNVIEEIAKARGKTTAQVSLRWVYEQGASMVPKSFNKERMRQNIDIFDWSLTEEEINKINQLPQRKGSTLASTFGPHDLVLEIDADI
ncbi:D-galacturonate reductase [Actinidia chinensis var. chinensis]|uniref:D-galacturonate reductase n=1 Tax=Actinidia chinensis var. chinensis TaxID=1590841 RepID=A0A2R6RE43_ACTCC|nr:D-galacturonate reductase [Actinidia chinensis var. chinensis]